MEKQVLEDGACGGKQLFVLEARLGPNEWRCVCDVYPQADLIPQYDDHELASRAKSRLKSLLLGPWKNRYRKKPIRIRKVSRHDSV